LLPTLFLYSPSLPIGLLWSVTHLYFLFFALATSPSCPSPPWRGTVHLNKSIHHIFHINYQHFFINMYLFKQISKYFPRFFSFIFFSFSLPFGGDRRRYLPNILSSLSSLLWSSKGNSFLIGKYSISSTFNILFKLG